jgi:predicted AAA+ superfamily ATPase
MLTRTPYANLWRELSTDKCLILMAGPRQCGKTTLAKLIANSFSNQLYFNWDIPTDKRKLMQDPFFFQSLPRSDTSKPLVVFDEIHKYRHWKNYLKGVYDEFQHDYSFLVTGSGRLDTYQKGGDSLAGRYYLFHLWPLTIAELANQQVTHNQFIKHPLSVLNSDPNELSAIWERLTSFSGFPEPYLTAKPASYQRWSTSYHQRLIREDIRDMTAIKSVEHIETLFQLLPARIGSPLSLTALAEDLKVAYNTIDSWLNVFERFYLIFTIKPWTNAIARSIRKERKTYLLDYALIDDPADRFENMVAVELMRAVSTWNDLGLGNYTLHFIRDKEKREVDFLVADKQKPVFMVEAKLSDETPSPALLRFQQKLKIPAVQLVRNAQQHRLLHNGDSRLLIAPPWLWLPTLP